MQQRKEIYFWDEFQDKEEQNECWSDDAEWNARTVVK